MHIHLYKFKEDKPNIMCIIVLYVKDCFIMTDLKCTCIRIYHRTQSFFFQKTVAHRMPSFGSDWYCCCDYFLCGRCGVSDCGRGNVMCYQLFQASKTYDCMHA